MVAQESVIANVELRNSFSLHCLHMETQLVHAHLEILATVLQSLVKVQIRGHSEASNPSILKNVLGTRHNTNNTKLRILFCLQLAEVWKLIEPTIMMCLPEKSAINTNGVSDN